jgi:hypothetical protein
MLAKYFSVISLTAFLLLAFNIMVCASGVDEKQRRESVPEPVDPNKYDLSVWKNIKPGIHSGFGSIDVAYSKSIPPVGAVAEEIKLQGWKGERVNCLLRPLLTMLAQAEQKCITTTLIDDPWAGKTYDPYGSMIRWIKKANGTWEYDYSDFDLYVNLAMESGIKEQISCYSMVPVGNKFSWFDEKSASSVTMEAIPGTSTYEEIWRNFLNDFKVHLREKGWLDNTAIALDEREEEEMIQTRVRLSVEMGPQAPAAASPWAGRGHGGVSVPGRFHSQGRASSPVDVF